MYKHSELSAHCLYRVERFWEAAKDPDIGPKRAIGGLKNWKNSQRHRLNVGDLMYIDQEIKAAECKAKRAKK